MIQIFLEFAFINAKSNCKDLLIFESDKIILNNYFQLRQNEIFKIALFSNTSHRTVNFTRVPFELNRRSLPTVYKLV